MTETAAPFDRARAHLPPIQRRILSPFEFWPGFLFYAPVALYWAWQGLRHRSFTLPGIANPLMENGGLCGESKVRLFASMAEEGRAWLAPYVSLRRGAAGELDCDVARLLDLMAAQGLDFPLVAKPDIGCHGAGVQVIRDRFGLRQYLAGFPCGEALLLQRLIDQEGEAGIFYVRPPGQSRGYLFSLTLKYFPHVRGDGCPVQEGTESDRTCIGRPRVFRGSTLASRNHRTTTSYPAAPPGRAQHAPP